MKGHKLNKSVSRELIIASSLGILFLTYLTFDIFPFLPYAVREGSAIVLNILMVAIAIEALTWLYSLRLKKSDDEKVPNKLNKYAAVSLTCFVCAFAVFANGWNTGGFYQNIEKKTQGSKYYLVLNGYNVRATKKQFDLVNESKKYNITYDWNKLLNTSFNLEIEEATE